MQNPKHETWACITNTISILNKIWRPGCSAFDLFRPNDQIVQAATWLLNKSAVQIHTCIPPSPTPSSGGARLFTHLRRHPGGLGQDGVVPGRHVGQRGAAGPAEGPAEGLDVESDPGERRQTFPKSPQCERGSTAPRGEGQQRSHLSRPGRWPAPQSLLLISIFVIITGPALCGEDECLVADQGHSVTRKAEHSWPWLL